jgi:hypothetical protein
MNLTIIGTTSHAIKARVRSPWHRVCARGIQKRPTTISLYRLCSGEREPRPDKLPASLKYHQCESLQFVSNLPIVRFKMLS